MKTYLSSFSFIVYLVLFSHFSLAQNTNCTKALSDYLFQSKKNFIERQSIQKSKLEAALKLSKENCLSTAQIKLIISLFTGDLERLLVAKNAYNSSIDKENFHQIYDTFSTFSSAILLYDFVKSKESHHPSSSHSSNIHSTYFISTEELQEIKELMKSESIDSRKNDKIKKILKKYPPCFSINQIKELMNLYSFSSYKLEFTKIMYQYVLPNDKRRYYLIAEEFSYFDKQELLEYIEDN
ncbi:DUF4476 domain-containing protein [Bernardetia sp. OM2101]|uniref:DUF4476 domain-containing protein n=1 Tax=Bernardetia sp. OM2101 TaxID=3344876 RepID=UPI0035D04814